MKKLIIILALLSCASSLPQTPSFRAPWRGASEYQAALVCATRMEYGHEIANEFSQVEVEVGPETMQQMATTVGRIIRIRSGFSKVKREALWRHEAVHWLENRRTGRWTYYPNCSAKDPTPDVEFLEREKIFNNAVSVCLKENSR